jgi:hypothetical protein
MSMKPTNQKHIYDKKTLEVFLSYPHMHITS